MYYIFVFIPSLHSFMFIKRENHLEHCHSLAYNLFDLRYIKLCALLRKATICESLDWIPFYCWRYLFESKYIHSISCLYN